MSAIPTQAESTHVDSPLPRIDEISLNAKVIAVANRWPSAGIAAAIVRDGSLEWFAGQGVADVESKEPITADTVFRVGSITKTFTAIAVMQLWERGLVDLDAPASEYLRAFQLIPARADFRPATVRHLLTHTAGLGYWRRLSDLLRPGIGSGLRAGRTVPSLPDYYRKGLPLEVEPGSKWVYSNHGFAVLGQLVEDVSGQPLGQYLREQVFGPLGMEHTDLDRSERVGTRLATGYVMRSAGLKPVADRGLLTPGAGAVCSTAADMARYVAALIREGAGEHGSVLKPATLASMFQPHYRLHPRVPGMGLGFELGEESGHSTVGKTGVVPGFHSAMVLAPEDGAGVVVLTNTGGLDARGVTEPLASALLRRVLGLPDSAIRSDVAARPDIWGDLCGWYGPEPGPLTNVFVRALVGAGVEVTVSAGHLMLKPLTLLPAMRHGFRLHPDDPADPLVFRAEVPEFGTDLHVAFSATSGDAPITRLVMNRFSFQKRPNARNPRRVVMGAAAGGALAMAACHLRRRGRS